MKKSFIFKMVAFAERHRYAIIIATALITIFFGYFATKLEIESSVRVFLPKSSKIIRLTKKYGGKLNNTEYLMIAFESKATLTLENATQLYSAIKQIESLPYFHKSINPFNVITFQKNGTKLDITTVAENGQAPKKEKDFELFKKRLKNDPIAQNLVVSKDFGSFAALFPVDSGVGYEKILKPVRAILKNLDSSFKTYVAGQYPIDETTEKYLRTDVPKFLLLAILIILFIYYFGFKTPRAILLPITTVALGTLWTIGTMSILHFKLTVVSIMTPPLVLTLGSSYSIHVLNQYYRETTLKANKIVWIAESVTHINKTILMASLTTVIGFISLISAQIRQIREFGIATSIGIVFCAILSLFLFPAVLSLLSVPTEAQKKRVTKDSITKLMGKIGNNLLRFRNLILIIIVLIIVLSLVSIRHIKYQTDFTKYYKKQEKAIVDNLYVVRKFGGFVYGYITLTGPADKNNYFLDPEILRKVANFEKKLKENHDISYISSFATYLQIMNKTMIGKYEIPKNRGLILLLSRYFKAIASTTGDNSIIGTVIHKNFNKLTVAIRIYNSDDNNYMLEPRFNTFIKKLIKDERETLGPDIKAEIWGDNLSPFFLSETLAHDLLTSVLFSALLIFLFTAIAFKSLLLGIFSLIPMLIGIMLNFIFIYLFKIPLDVITITFSSVAIGVGVDTSIHLIIQFNRQRKLLINDANKILSNTLQISGRPIFLTTISLISGLSVLILSSFTPIMYFGILVSMVLFTTAIGALIVLPAILSFLIRNHKSEKNTQIY
ncbi:MAG: MMPL family transporter [Spirochaetales bacterium]|nr:MMPL family transporter [Spirochaetales bacterium]